MSNPQEQFLDLYRAGLKAGVDMMRASLQGAEFVRNRELAAIHAALAEIARSSAEIDAARSFEELTAIQAKLAKAQLESASSYWSGLWQAAGDGQSETMKLLKGHAARISASLQDASQAAAGANEHMRQALQAILGATSSALGTRAVPERAPELAGSEAETASAGVRRAGGRGERKTA
jgi:phasin family protein